MVVLDEALMDKNATDPISREPNDETMSPMALHFLIVGILFITTVLVWAVYFYIQYSGIQNWRECFGGRRGICGGKRMDGSSVNSVSGWVHQNEIKRQSGGGLGLGGSSSTGRSKFTATKLKPSMNSRL